MVHGRIVRESWSGKTHTGSQDGRILSVVGNDDEPAECSHRVHKEKQTDERPGHLCKHLFAQLAGATTFDTVQVRVDPTGISNESLRTWM